MARQVKMHDHLAKIKFVEQQVSVCQKTDLRVLACREQDGSIDIQVQCHLVISRLR